MAAARLQLKIIQLITRLIVGGAQRIAIETASALRSRGIEAEIWCGRQAGPEGSLAGEARARGIPIIWVPSLVKEVDPLRDLAALAWLTHRLRGAGAEVVHTHSSKAGILGRRAARWAGVPGILHTVHGWGFSDRTPAPARAAFVAAERRAAAWADRIVAVSQEVRAEGLRLDIGRPESYRVIRPGIDVRPFTDLDELRRRGSELRSQLGIPHEAFLAGTVGRLSPQKNPMMILDAARTIPECHWLLVGDGPLRSDLERQVAQWGLDGRVHFAGLRTDTAASLGALDLFVLVSLWEGLPLTILEAEAAGVPIVAARVGGVVEVLPQTPSGWGFAAGDAEAFQQSVCSCIAAGAAAKEAALRHREQALREHSLQRMFADLFGLYESVLGKPLPATESTD